MAQKLDYFDIDFMFHKLFTNANEKFWYQQAWEILGKYELNTFANKEEKIKVYINAATLGVIYEDFFAIADNSYSNYDDYIENLHSVIKKENQIALFKNMFIKSFPKEEPKNYDFDDEYDGYKNLSNALLLSTRENRYDILKTLKKEMNETQICLAIYCSSLPIYKPIKLDEYEDDEEDNYKPKYADYLATTDYDAYWKSFYENFGELYNLYEYKLGEAFNWIQNGAEQRN